MDQLKETLAKLGKHGFWIACGLVTVISLGVWWMATGSLVEQYEAEAAKLDAATSAISSIQSQMATHPNDASHEVMEELISAQEEEVLEAWRMQYEEQQGILEWPEVLGPEFINVFAPLVPIELNFQEFPVPEELEKERTYRERYRDYIKDVMGPMAEKAGAEWKADFNAASNTMGGYGMGEGSGMSDFGSGMSDYGSGPGGEMGYGPGALGGRGPMIQKKPPLVEWPTQSQEALLSDLFPWRGNIPTTLEVLYSQENLWVLDQLLQIVADTNGDATQRFQAKIHEIQKIGIGRSATRANGIISPVGGARGGMGMGPEGSGYGMEMGGEMGGEMDYGSEMAGGSMMGEGSGMGGEMGYGMGQEAVQIDPAEGRYVNVDYEPIEASRVRSAMVSNSPEDAALAVAKRIPVMLRLKMDQRHIPELLATCGNASLMVEVRQVRVEPKGTAGGAGAGGYSSMGSGSGGYGGSPGGEMMGESYGGSDGYGGGSSGGMNAQQTFPMDMVVEVYGIIYLFNPPAVERLGVEQVNESTVIDGKSMAEEEADTGVITAPVEAAVDPPAEPDLPTQPAEGADDAAGGEPAGQGQPGQPQPAPGQPQPGQPQPGQPQPAPGQPQGAPGGTQPAPGAAQPAPAAP